MLIVSVRCSPCDLNMCHRCANITLRDKDNKKHFPNFKAQRVYDKALREFEAGGREKFDCETAAKNYTPEFKVVQEEDLSRSSKQSLSISSATKKMPKRFLTESDIRKVKNKRMK